MVSIDQKLLDGHFANDESVTTPIGFKNAGCEQATSYVLWGEGVSAGEVTVEGAPEPDYTGKWTALAVFTFDASVDVAPKAEYESHAATFGAIRHRITSEVLDGFVTTRIRGTEA